MPWNLFTLQKGIYDSEQRIVQLKSTLVGNASKVNSIYCFTIGVFEDGFEFRNSKPILSFVVVLN